MSTAAENTAAEIKRVLKGSGFVVIVMYVVNYRRGYKAELLLEHNKYGQWGAAREDSLEGPLWSWLVSAAKEAVQASEAKEAEV